MHPQNPVNMQKGRLFAKAAVRDIAPFSSGFLGSIRATNNDVERYSVL
jgi:hypothetical protein